MSDYTQITSFAPKDSLTTGDPNKKIRGSQLDPEFSAIATAIQSKFDSADVASDAEAAALTSDTKLITPDKLAHALQNATLTLGSGISLGGTATFPNVNGAVTATDEELNVLDGVTASTSELNILDGVTATAAELNSVDGFTGGATDLNNLVSRLGGIKVAYCRVNTDGTLNTSYANKNINSTSRASLGTYTVDHTAAGFTEPPVILSVSVVAAISTNTQFTGSETTITSITTSNDLASGALVDRAFWFLAIGV